MPRTKDGGWMLDDRDETLERYKAIAVKKDEENPKPRKYPDLGADMGFNDSYDTLRKVIKAGNTVAIDFDGTLTTDADGTLSPRMLSVVERLLDEGMPVTVFTARDPDDVRQKLRDGGWPDLPVTNQKSPDFGVYLDDRAVHFDPEDVKTESDVDGLVDQLRGFKAWWEKRLATFAPCDKCGGKMRLMPPDFETLRCEDCHANRPVTKQVPPAGQDARKAPKQPGDPEDAPSADGTLLAKSIEKLAEVAESLKAKDSRIAEEPRVVRRTKDVIRLCKEKGHGKPGHLCLGPIQRVVETEETQ